MYTLDEEASVLHMKYSLRSVSFTMMTTVEENRSICAKGCLSVQMPGGYEVEEGGGERWERGESSWEEGGWAQEI